MAHFAQINENNIVTEVIVVSNEKCGNVDFPDSEPIGQAFLVSIGLEGSWKQTSYNDNFRVRYAGLNYRYDAIRDAFISPQPYLSWIFDESTLDWKAPIPYPDDENNYYWDETTTEWKLINE